MTQGPLHWLYPAITLTLSAIALLLIAWALFSDRSRGRKRCPKCWYDAASGSMVCPECGRTARSEAALLRTRRRWGWVAAGLVLLVAAQSVRMTPRAIARGARGLIPTFVLARWWPMDIDGWLTTSPLEPVYWSRDPMLEEWFVRREEGIGVGDSAAWLRRVESRLRALRDSDSEGGPDVSGIMVIDLRRVWAESAPQMGLDPSSRGTDNDPIVRQLAGFVSRIVPFASGVVASGVEAGAATLVESLEHANRADSAGSDDANWAAQRACWAALDRTIIPGVEPADTLEQILRRISDASRVACEAMDSDYFRMLARFDEPCGLELKGQSAVSVMDAIIAHIHENTSVSMCEWAIHGRSFRLQPTDSQSADCIRVFRPPGRLASLPTSERVEAMKHLMSSVLAHCSPDSWNANGGDHEVRLLGDRMIVRAPLPLICKVALYLEHAANDPITPGPESPAGAGPPGD